MILLNFEKKNSQSNVNQRVFKLILDINELYCNLTF